MLPTTPLAAISERHLDKEALIEAPPERVADAYGEPQPEGPWRRVAEGVPCRLAPMSASEQITDAQQAAEETWTLVFPKGTDVKATYRARIEGRVFQVQGPTGERSYEAMRKVTAVEYTD